MKLLKSKGFIFASLVILCFLAGILSFPYIPSKILTKLPFTPKPTQFVTLPKPNATTKSWSTFSDDNLSLSLKYPSRVMLDPKQTVKDRLYAFIFKEDQESLEKIPTLYIANTHKAGRDGFTAFRNSDCKQPCPVSEETANWIIINNAYGIRNPLPNDVANYYLIDKNQQGIVVNAYVGGNKSTQEKDVKEKIATFEQMILTIQFRNKKGHIQTP